jgi:hypothetical protein
MKNIHLIPTPNPSRLYSMNIYNGLRLSKNDIVKSDIHTPKNIYITSDEEIKEGEYCITKTNEVIKFKKSYTQGFLYKKIILTTDQDLIKFTAENDDVQAIPDEFLEWFVKNPSCEYVEVEESTLLNTSRTYLGVDKYKIIIPQNETSNPADFMQLGEKAFEENVHEKLRETLSPTEKQMWISGYLLALTQQNKK